MSQLDVINQRGGSRVCNSAATAEPLLPLMRLGEQRLLAGQLEKTEHLVPLQSENRPVGVLTVVVQRHMHVELCAVDEVGAALPAHEDAAVVELAHLLPSRFVQQIA
jgi:hypothetical protein